MNCSVNLITQLNIALKKRAKFFICKKSKLNISLLQLLINKGFILNFYQFKFSKGNLCVFLKYLDKKPLMTKIVLVKKNIFLTSLSLYGDIQTNIFFVISTSIGGLLLLSLNNFNNLNWYNKLGGKILFKICV